MSEDAEGRWSRGEKEEGTEGRTERGRAGMEEGDIAAGWSVIALGTWPVHTHTLQV